MPKFLKDKHKDRAWFDTDGVLWYWAEGEDYNAEWFYMDLRKPAHERVGPKSHDPYPVYGPFRQAVPKSG